MASGAGQERAEIEALADHASESRDGAGTDVVQVFSFFPAGPAAALPVTVQPGIREPPVLAWCQPPSHLEAAAAATTPAIAAAAADTAAAADDNAAFDDTPSAEDTSPHPNTVDTAASADTAASDCPPQPAGKLAARRRYDDFGAPRYELHLAVNRWVDGTPRPPCLTSFEGVGVLTGVFDGTAWCTPLPLTLPESN